MSIETPHTDAHTALAALASRFVETDDLPWETTPFPGVEVKILMRNSETGAHTSLTRMAPGARQARGCRCTSMLALNNRSYWKGHWWTRRVP